MKATMKKVFSLMLVAVLMVGMLPFQASATGNVSVYVYDADTNQQIGNGQIAPGDHSQGAFSAFCPAGTTFDWVSVLHDSNHGSHGLAGSVYSGNVSEGQCIHVFAKKVNACTYCGATGHEASAHCTLCAELTHSAADHCGQCGAYGHDVSAHCTLCAELNHSAADHCSHCGAYGHAASAHCTLCAELNHSAADHCSHCGAYGHALSAHCTLCGELHESGSCVTDPAPTDPVPAPTDPVPTTCSVCGGEVTSYGTCKRCELDINDCQCCSECKNLITEHARGCSKAPQSENNQGKIKFTPKFNDGFGRFYSGTPVYVSQRATMADVFAQIAVPADYKFSYWSWDKDGREKINNHDRLPSHDRWNTEFVIYAQYSKDVQATKGVDIRVNLNYDRRMGETLRNVAFGSRMSDVLSNIQNPYRWGYKFRGWYYDAEGKVAVNGHDKVTRPITIYAKWEQGSYDTMLKIYINGDTKSATKIIDMHNYANDGWITLDEVKEVVKQYYNAKNADGLSYYGLFDAANWNSYLRNHRHHGEYRIPVERFNDTTVNVMVYNAVARSSATADKTNPKTGDMIMTSVAVMGLSASALAVMFYLNKKRAI